MIREEGGAWAELGAGGLPTPGRRYEVLGAGGRVFPARVVTQEGVLVLCVAMGCVVNRAVEAVG